jgi:hypothetical protein
MQSVAPAETAVEGRLATVEPRSRRITVVIEGESELTELTIDEDGDVRRDDDAITLSDLVGLVGNRVKIVYRTDGSRKVARSLTVEAPAPPDPPQS